MTLKMRIYFQQYLPKTTAVHDDIVKADPSERAAFPDLANNVVCRLNVPGASALTGKQVGSLLFVTRHRHVRLHLLLCSPL